MPTANPFAIRNLAINRMASCHLSVVLYRLGRLDAGLITGDRRIATTDCDVCRVGSGLLNRAKLQFGVAFNTTRLALKYPVVLC